MKKPRELSPDEKKACILFTIAILSKGTAFICHCFTDFVKTETNILPEDKLAEDYMHIIFPELYRELKSLVELDVFCERYNANNTRMGNYFNISSKGVLWHWREVDERIHFLNDLNDSLK